MSNFKIENGEPQLGLMVREYRVMLSGRRGRFLLGFILFTTAVWGLWYLLPSATSPDHPVLGAVAFLACYSAIGWSGLLAFWLASPLIARLLLPLVILVLEIARTLLEGVQYMIDVVVIKSTTESQFYPDTNKPW